MDPMIKKSQKEEEKRQETTQSNHLISAIEVVDLLESNSLNNLLKTNNEPISTNPPKPKTQSSIKTFFTNSKESGGKVQ
jgi:hypothetical protein